MKEKFMSIRPRRSVLYMPGSNVRALEKAKALPADVFILDLEDAVAPDQKEAARPNILAALREGGYGRRELVMRVNGLDTPWGDEDLRAAATSGAHSVCIPKVESAEQVLDIVARLERYGAPADQGLWVMAETPRGILNAQQICGAHRRLSVLMLGTSDLAKDLRVPHRPDRIGFITSLSLCVLAARAHGLDVLDGVHLNINDPAGFRAVCEQGRALGFDGKTLIHPNQVEIANEVFGLDQAAIEHAHRVIEVWENAEKQGMGVAVLNGKLVENLHAAEARRVLILAEAIAALTAPAS
jgi:citrate lyase subunit beta/citryl-CoA lyase